MCDHFSLGKIDIFHHIAPIKKRKNLNQILCVDKMLAQPNPILCVDKIPSPPNKILCVAKMRSGNPTYKNPQQSNAKRVFLKENGHFIQDRPHLFFV